ncbi:MAG TPA: N-acetyltransferase [Dongiaceae bacterium]|nr:N-acetyltransferase [Dongiaceae bacterium]
MPVAIEPQGPADSAAIEALLDECFGPDRRRKQSYRFREATGPVEALSLVARDGERLVGTIRQWPVVILGSRHATPALLLGPVGVAADRRKERIGDRLIRESLGLADELGHGIVLLVGELGYYGRFGFRPAAPHGIFMPGEEPHRLQVLELAPGALTGVAGDLWPVSAGPARRYGT